MNSVELRSKRRAIEFGFMMGLSPREPIGRFAQLAQLAESVGFDMAWMADSQLYTKDPWVALTLAATATKTIKLGPGVTNPATRHITVTTCVSSALAEVSGNRCVLGFGSGDAAIYPLGLKVKVDDVATAIKQYRTLSAGGAIDIDGKSIKVATAGASVPLYLAASQPRMLRLAGAMADGVILMGAAQPELTRWQLAHVAAGAADAGRTLDDIFIDLWFTISISDDKKRALDDVRPWAASQARLFATWKELPPSLEPFTEDFRHAAEAYDFSRHLSRSGEPEPVSDAFTDWIGVSGTAEECAAKIRPLLDMKIDRLTLALLPGGREARLRQYGNDLIPRLRALAATQAAL
jgi:5,10-methylenetetrahydromethanopterin reductase